MFMKLCWGAEGCTWETQRCQRATLEIGRQMKKNSMSLWVPTYSFPLAPPYSDNAFWSFRGGICPSSLNVSGSSLEGSWDCEWVPLSPPCFCWLFVSPPQHLLLHLFLTYRAPPPSLLQVLAVASPLVCPSRSQRLYLAQPRQGGSGGNVNRVWTQGICTFGSLILRLCMLNTPAEDCERQVDFAVHGWRNPTVGCDLEAEA